MIKLVNVSKFYYSKGIIASGISRVNLDLDLGEFVVITGESGSGKSTLLNVISGLDTYEEGEMYVGGEETSHYTASDFEEYRKKYIGNIFQSFNLITSYTAAQNVALALEINGASPETVKEKVPEMLEKVGMSEYAHTKVSKLSGGQKQRVAIARALAKDTKIIVADEPTGNLDSESAAGIVTLLGSLAKDRLVIVVTHNFEQFAHDATRIIKMHDGRIVEDTGIKTARERELSEQAEPKGKTEEEAAPAGKMSGPAQIRLGARNTFNILPKFLLLLLVFLFLVSSVTSQYVSVKKMRSVTSEIGFNNYFTNYSANRLVVEKKDKSPFTEEDYQTISKIPNTKKLVKNDMVMDTEGYIENGEFSFYGYFLEMDLLKDTEITAGQKPGKGETAGAVLQAPKGYYDLDPDRILGQEFSVDGGNGQTITVTVTGISLYEDSDEAMYQSYIYLSPEILNEVRMYNNAEYSGTYTEINGIRTDLSYSSSGYRVTANDMVSPGQVILPAAFNDMFENGAAYGRTLPFLVENQYYRQTLDLTVQTVYAKWNYESVTGLTDFELHDGEIYVNPEDFKTLYGKGNYQTSVYADGSRNVDEVKAALEKEGYDVMALRDHASNLFDSEVLSILQLPFAVAAILVVFFIAYLVIRLILKSRSGYFAILRMLGATRKQSRRIMDVELVLVSGIAFVLYLGFILLSRAGILPWETMRDMLLYMRPLDFLILLAILLAMTLLISRRFMRTIFRRSAMGAYREEV